jgi:hypothetical protein
MRIAFLIIVISFILVWELEEQEVMVVNLLVVRFTEKAISTTTSPFARKLSLPEILNFSLTQHSV